MDRSKIEKWNTSGTFLGGAALVISCISVISTIFESYKTGKRTADDHKEASEFRSTMLAALGAPIPDRDDDDTVELLPQEGFMPIPGAAGFQLGNPSTLAFTALLASLENFALAFMSAIRATLVAQTEPLEDLPLATSKKDEIKPFKIKISNPAQRGVQLSL